MFGGASPSAVSQSPTCVRGSVQPTAHDGPHRAGAARGAKAPGRPSCARRSGAAKADPSFAACAVASAPRGAGTSCLRGRRFIEREKRSRTEAESSPDDFAAHSDSYAHYARNLTESGVTDA